MAVEWARQQGRVVSDPWQREDARIRRMNAGKVKAVPENPFWRSAAIAPAPTKASGKARILVIGDSFVWGDGYVNANDIWWRQLERELHRRGYWNVEVVAAGFNGLSTQDELVGLRSGGLARLGSPDLVVLGYVTNDPDVRDAKGRPLVKDIARDVPQWRVLDRSIGRVAPTLANQLRQRLTAKWQASIMTPTHTTNGSRSYWSPPISTPSATWWLSWGRCSRDGQTFLRGDVAELSEPHHFGPRHAPIGAIFRSAGLRSTTSSRRSFASIPQGARCSNGVSIRHRPSGHREHALLCAPDGGHSRRDYHALLGSKLPLPASRRPRINDWMPPAAEVRQVRDSEWEFAYPSPSDEMLEMPFGKRHVMLAFEEPVPIEALRLAGDALVDAEIFLASIDPATGIRTQGTNRARPPDRQSACLGHAESPRGGSRNTIRIVAELAPEATRPETQAPLFDRLREERGPAVTTYVVGIFG